MCALCNRFSSSSNKYTVTQSTVLLNVNVAFLAIQSVDDSSAKEGRSPAQISSYISVIASIGSIILGLLLIRKNRWMAKNSPAEAVSCQNRHFSNSADVL